MGIYPVQHKANKPEHLERRVFALEAYLDGVEFEDQERRPVALASLVNSYRNLSYFSSGS